jgi:hypothetical protein
MKNDYKIQCTYNRSLGKWTQIEYICGRHENLLGAVQKGTSGKGEGGLGKSDAN